MGINHDMDRSMNQFEDKSMNQSESKSMNQSMEKSLGKSMYRFMNKFNGKFMRWVLLCLAVVFILLGMHSGETQDVLRKAVNICMECIGIG